MTAIDFNQQAAAHANTVRDNQLSDLADQSLTALTGMPFPTRKTEDWKYTSLTALTKQDYNQSASDFSLPGSLQSLYQVAGLNGPRLVFVNGQLDANQSSLSVVDGLELLLLSGMDGDEKKALVSKLGCVAEVERNLFTAINNAAISECVYLKVGKGIELDSPIQIVHVTTAQPTPATVYGRCFIELEALSQATVVEQFVSTDEELNVVVNQTTEVVVGDGAKLNHYRLNSEHESALHFGGVYVDLNRDSQFESYQVLLGGKIKRLDVLVNHNVGGSHCEMKGVYLPKNNQHVDVHSYIEHKAAHCTTNETYRGIMADKSKAVFNGRIHIHPDAQKTLAELSNKNLLLSNEAQINTKPELEIYADDVRCAHGATVAQLDEKAKFYLRSRGISAQEADIMLSFGFINELFESIPLEPVRNQLRPLLAQQFTSNKELTKHLIHEEDAQ